MKTIPDNVLARDSSTPRKCSCSMFKAMKTPLIAGLICCVFLAWSVYRLQTEDEAYDKGVWFEEHGNPEQAFLWFQRAASEGDLDGKDMLGYCYGKGMGTARNYRKALTLFQETARAGSAVGAFNLAIAYESGHGTPRDMNQAFFWYRKSAERGDPDAMYELAQCYRTGSGIAENPALARRWMRKAAAEDQPEALYALGVEYLEKGDAAQAVSFFRRAAAGDSIAAQYQLGLCCEKGKGTERSLSSAVKWYKAAAEGDDVSALLKLSELYAAGTGVPQNADRAAELRRRAEAERAHEAQSREDFSTFFDQVRAAIEKRDDAEALRRFRWFYREWSEYHSWLDEWSRWEKLFAANPEARAFLTEAVRKLQAAVLEGDCSAKAVNGILEINRFLQRDDDTVAFYRELLKRHPKKAKRYWTADYLILFLEKNQFETAAELTDPEREFDTQVKIYRGLTSLGDRESAPQTEARFKQVSGALATLLRQSGKNKEADRLEQRAREIVKAGRAQFPDKVRQPLLQPAE